MSLKTIKLNLYLTSDVEKVVKTVDDICGELSLSTVKQKSALRLLLANLFCFSDRKIALSRKKTSHGASRYNPFKIGYRPLLKTLDRLVESGLIIQEVGEKHLSTGEGRLTLISATDELKVRFHQSEWSNEDFRQVNPELIRLKRYQNNGKSKELVDYEDTEVSLKFRREIERYIDLLSEVDITLYDERNGIHWEYDGEPVYRSFIQMSPDAHSFTYGGRLYGPWASMDKNQRRAILINGDNTVEHDFQASHVNTMYLMVNSSTYPTDDDPYSLDVDSKTVPRHIVKKLSSIMINVKNRREAIEAIEKDYQKHESDEARVNEVKEFALFNSTDLVRVVDCYLEKHSEIAHLFLKGKEAGNYIQYMESCRVMNIINQLVDMKIPVLSVYDSFIVAKQNELALLELMSSECCIDAIAA